jgi:transcriptional regulator GlxA family with amidase domain
MHGMAASRRQVLAREAEAWLRQNLTEPLTIADLCQAVQTSERTLHSTFRERLGTTPKLHLKALRLEAARRELQRGAPGTRITDVALNWGFLHFGWFSHDYRRCFGETPSDTLRRACRSASRPALVPSRAARPREVPQARPSAAA